MYARILSPGQSGFLFLTAGNNRPVLSSYSETSYLPDVQVVTYHFRPEDHQYNPAHPAASDPAVFRHLPA